MSSRREPLTAAELADRVQGATDELGDAVAFTGEGSRAVAQARERLRHYERRLGRLHKAELARTRFDGMPVSDAARLIVDEAQS